MKKNGFAPLILIILIVILGIALYFAYQTYKSSSEISVNPSSTPSAVSSPSPTINTNLPVIAATSGQKTTIDVGGKAGSMLVLPGWQVVKSESADPVIGEGVDKNVEIKNGEYTIEISTFGDGRAPCFVNEHGTTSRDALFDSYYVYFKDQSGYEYLRLKVPTPYTEANTLDVCSNANSFNEPAPNTGMFVLDEAVFGDIHYKVPANPDPTILNQMDSMVASFKSS